MERQLAAARRHVGAGLMLSSGVHLIAFVVVAVMIRTAGSSPPVRPRRSITFLTFAPQTPRMVTPAMEDVRARPAIEQRQSREEPAVARPPEPTPSRHVTSTAEPPNTIDVVKSEPVSAEVVPTTESRAAVRAQPVVGLFDARPAGADRRRADRPSSSVELAGFGQAASQPEARADRSAGELRPAGFDLRASAPSPAAVTRRDQTDRPVEITFKPSPEYTEEAKMLKVEGEVRLEVVFCASGDVRVLRVLDGLGHGLDETAARAARQIRFRPASSGGVAVDLRTTLHITFRVS